MMKVLHTFLCKKLNLKMVTKALRTQVERVHKEYKCALIFLLCTSFSVNRYEASEQKVLTF